MTRPHISHIWSKRLNQWTTTKWWKWKWPHPHPPPVLDWQPPQPRGGRREAGGLTEISALKSKAASFAGHKGGGGWSGVGDGAICSIGQVASLLPSIISKNNKQTKNRDIKQYSWHRLCLRAFGCIFKVIPLRDSSRTDQSLRRRRQNTRNCRITIILKKKNNTQML